LNKNIEFYNIETSLKINKMPRNAQGMWVSQDEVNEELKKQGKKSNDSFLGVSFKEDLTSSDYQRILIEQNQAIIQLLSVQCDNIIQGTLSGGINRNYQYAIKDYTLDKH
tara:strand:- start:332 stop:661 length:330 start_codon:yes stop_codon:yes gene_type:complete